MYLLQFFSPNKASVIQPDPKSVTNLSIYVHHHEIACANKKEVLELSLKVVSLRRLRAPDIR
jgi:hypothetical protein